MDAENKIRLAALGLIAGVRVETRGVGQIIPGSDSLLHTTEWSEDAAKSRPPSNFPPEYWRIETRLIIDLEEAQ